MDGVLKMYKVNGQMKVASKKENNHPRKSIMESDFIFKIEVNNGKLEEKFPFVSRLILILANNEKEAIQKVEKGWGYILDHVI